jgi:hypothetical protein
MTPERVAWLLGVALAALTVDALVRERGEFDYRLMRAVQRVDGPGLEQALRFFNGLTGTGTAVAVWAMVLVACLATRRWLVATALAAFPVAAYLVARASATRSVLEPAISAGVAIAGSLVLLGVASPVAGVFALALAPVAFGLACAGAWFGMAR